MADVLNTDKQIAVISALAEAPSIRAIERMIGIRRQEKFQGRVVGDGVVEVFDLTDHPDASRICAWAHETDDPKQPRQYVTMLHIPPVVSPQAAVRAAILQEYKSRAKSN